MAIRIDTGYDVGPRAVVNHRASAVGAAGVILSLMVYQLPVAAEKTPASCQFPMTWFRTPEAPLPRTLSRGRREVHTYN